MTAVARNEDEAWAWIQADLERCRRAERYDEEGAVRLAKARGFVVDLGKAYREAREAACEMPTVLGQWIGAGPEDPDGGQPAAMPVPEEEPAEEVEEPLPLAAQLQIERKAREAAAAKKISAEPQPVAEAEPSAVPAVVIPPAAVAALEQVELINAKHAVIGNYGGKCAVLSWEPWDINPKYLKPVFQSFGDFRNRYLNRYITIENDAGISRVSAGKYWLQHPRRLNYDGVGFDPAAPPVLPGNRLNLWRDLAIKPHKGSWRLLRRHIYLVLGGGDRKAGRYIVRWLAWMFQNLNAPAETVLVFQGDEGAGKGIVVRALLKIFGPYALPISDPKSLIGAFSGHLHHCLFLFIDEAFWAGNVQAEGRLKSLITEETITIEPKYFAPFQAHNMLHMVMASNNDWVVPAGPTARRYAVF